MGALSTNEEVARVRAVLFVRDEALRDTLATILGDLSSMLLSVVDNVEAARHAVREESSVLVVAPAWRDRAVDALLRELSPTETPTVIVSASIEHRVLARDGAVFVHAPFDVDTFLDAIQEAVDEVRGTHRRSCTLPVAR